MVAADRGWMLDIVSRLPIPVVLAVAGGGLNSLQRYLDALGERLHLASRLAAGRAAFFGLMDLKHTGIPDQLTTAPS